MRIQKMQRINIAAQKYINIIVQNVVQCIRKKKKKK
jgi:hypothetical protein